MTGLSQSRHRGYSSLTLFLKLATFLLRERARSDKHTARVLLPDPVTREEETRLLYARDVGLIVAGPGLITRPNAIETPTQRKRRKDRMTGKLEPLVRFGAFEVLSEQEWQAAKEV